MKITMHIVMVKSMKIRKVAHAITFDYFKHASSKCMLDQSKTKWCYFSNEKNHLKKLHLNLDLGTHIINIIDYNASAALLKHAATSHQYPFSSSITRNLEVDGCGCPPKESLFRQFALSTVIRLGFLKVVFSGESIWAPLSYFKKKYSNINITLYNSEAATGGIL